MIWDPDQYLKYETPRLRPALELLSRISHPNATDILDLGCGPGTVTAFLAQRWPDAAVSAVDNDPSMLERAAAVVPSASLVDADIATFQPSSRFDVIYSNATLHWLDDHPGLFPRIVSWLNQRGVLAVQMPAPDDQPTHLTALRLARQPQWEDRLVHRLRRGAVAKPVDYFELLSPHLKSLDIWTVTYLQVLQGADPVTEWAKGSFLRPLLAELDEAEAHELLRLYSEAMAIEYPPRSDGTTLLPYTRLFLAGRIT